MWKKYFEQTSLRFVIINLHISLTRLKILVEDYFNKYPIYIKVEQFFCCSTFV